MPSGLPRQLIQKPLVYEVENKVQENRGLAIGLALGVALGVAFNSLAVGIALGLVFGISYDRRQQTK